MSEPIPESIPISQDKHSKRPLKKRALVSAAGQQASQLDALFKHPEREVAIPASATRDAVPRQLPAPPEIVANVQGSSAGAGSGEFHVYKAARRREYERMRLMDEEVRREKANVEFEARQSELKARDDAKTNKNKARREKIKARKLQKARTLGNGASGLAAAAAGDAMDTGADARADGEAVGTRNGSANRNPGEGSTTRGGEGSASVANEDEIGIIIHDEDGL
ncbi:MAG: hypothetical protein M1825_005870 [Sarcosagium campestre]|nr:MAG: hypothetical protein M1825_005870 [Sarcosagium campestre]